MVCIMARPISFSTVQRNRLRWLVIARLQTIGISEDEMSSCTGMSRSRIATTLRSPTYQEWRNARLKSAVSAIDAIISQDDRAMKEGLRELVPLAIATLEKSLSSDDESIRLRAAQEILDRDERFNKAAVQIIEHRIPQSELDRARELAKQLRPQTLHALSDHSEVIEAEIVSESIEQDTSTAPITPTNTQSLNTQNQ